MSTLARAVEIAIEAHAGQTDKAGWPYIEHVLRVVDAVEGDVAKTVAALHDLFEDCEGWDYQRLVAEGFPFSIADHVWALTKRSNISYNEYIAWLIVWGAPVVREVKIADLRDNSDPSRLALLPERDRERLSRKYAAALAQLDAA